MALQQTHLLPSSSSSSSAIINICKNGSAVANPKNQFQTSNLISFPLRSGIINNVNNNKLTCVRGSLNKISASSGSGDHSQSHNQNQKGGSSSTSSSSVSNSNYVVPLDNKGASGITRPLAEILRDLNKRIPHNILKPFSKIVPWYHANRMLSFYAPGWCGDVRDVIFSDNGSVTVVYRVTIRGSDGEAYRESIGTVLCSESNAVESIAAAEEIAFVKACARFGLGLYLYHEE